MTLQFDRKAQHFAFRLTLTEQEFGYCLLQGEVENLKTKEREPLFRDSYLSLFRADADSPALRNAVEAVWEGEADPYRAVLPYSQALGLSHLIAVQVEQGAELVRVVQQRFDLTAAKLRNRF